VLSLSFTGRLPSLRVPVEAKRARKEERRMEAARKDRETGRMGDLLSSALYYAGRM
jgi:hypothetical protein